MSDKKNNLATQEAEAAQAARDGLPEIPVEVNDAMALACKVMSREAQLTARIADGEEKQILLALAAAFKDPARVAAFIGKVA